MLDIDRALLVVIDIQGKLAQLMCEKERLFANCAVLIRTTRFLEVPVIWCEQNPDALGATVPELAELLGGCEAVRKFSFSCCGEPQFIWQLKSSGRTQVILCGIETHVCVYQSAAELAAMGFEVCVPADAVSSRTAENKRIALDRIVACGGAVSSTEMVLFELIRTAKHPKFKDIARLIK